MIKKLSLMSKVELYYRTRSSYNIIDTLLVSKDDETIYFTREHENLVIWETDINYYSEEEPFTFRRGEILNYEQFIDKFKDYYFDYFHEYPNYIYETRRNSVFPENNYLAINKKIN